ncbi:MAG: hypothetical protein BWZ11_01299 [Bacteroidetes bacterium ADurb.BinA395]|nr:MAG: hypothetical protein BWZ11_01299 [Bacteroidetes bacterium ADurb.BinA395]
MIKNTKISNYCTFAIEQHHFIFMNSKPDFLIDIEKVVKEKAPNTFIPTFLVSYLRKIVHEKEINELLATYSHQKNVDFLESAVKYFQVNVSIKNRENLPHDDKLYIFAGNHPLGGMDAIMTGSLLGREYDGKIRFMANDMLMFIEPLKDLFIPVNKVGSQGKNHVRELNDFFSSDCHLITYPAGKCSRKSNGKIQDEAWNKNFVVKAIQHQRDIVPIYFDGKNSNFFYNLANLRKFFHIKFNIEMLYLSDEMFKQKGKSFSLVIGEPIRWQTFDRSKTYGKWAQWVKEKVYALSEKTF